MTHGSIRRGVPCQVYPRVGLHSENKGILLRIYTTTRNRIFAHVYLTPTVVVVPYFHPWASYDSIQLSELPYERFVTREVGSGTRKTMETVLAERGLDLTKLNIAMELGSTQAIKQVVCAGLGITIISALTVRRECDQGILKALRIQDDPVYRPLNILTLAKSSQTKYERTFINFLHNHKLLKEILTQNYCSKGMRYLDTTRAACDK